LLFRFLFACLSTLALGACQTLGSVPETAVTPLAINIAHINDHHSHLDAHDFEIPLGGVATQLEVGGFARLTTLFRRHAHLPNLLKIHAGDAQTGTLYHTLYHGEADAALMNTVCFDVFALGNHEFDEGDAGLRGFLDHLRDGSCRTAVLAANVEPAIGTPLAPERAGDYVRPYLLRQFDGITVGIIGIDVRGKTIHSSRPLATTIFHDEVETAQRVIDELRARGIRHIILVTHQGYAADQVMAAKLSDVDVIIGGDSHTLLGDFPTLGARSSGPYPTVVRNRDGDPVCIGQAWEYAKAFGLMNVRFDARGAVAGCSGEVMLPIAPRFRQRDVAGNFVAVNAETHAALVDQIAKQEGLRIVEADADAQAVLEHYASRLETMASQRIGTAGALCLVRVPGESGHRSAGVAGCETANAQARGSDVAQAVASAYRQASPLADLALQNGGGVRTAIAAGDVSYRTAYEVLPFNNVLIEMQLSGRQILDVLEEAVANHLDDGGSDGSHPYAAGLRWQLDLSRARGQRINGVEIQDRDNQEWRPLDPDRLYTVVVNDYLAQGGDGYSLLARIHRSGNGVNTYLNYTQTFVDYLLAHGRISRPPAAEYSHQSVITRDGRRLP